MIDQAGGLRAETIEVRRLGPGQVTVLARAIEVLGPAAKQRWCRSDVDIRGSPDGRALASPSCYAFLASDAGSLIGYLSAYRFPRLDDVGDQVYLFDVEVATGARRRGVGRRLVESLLAACWAEGVTLVWAGTALENTAAQQLFATVGGQRVAETYVEYHFTPGG